MKRWAEPECNSKSNRTDAQQGPDGGFGHRDESWRKYIGAISGVALTAINPINVGNGFARGCGGNVGRGSRACKGKSGRLARFQCTAIAIAIIPLNRVVVIVIVVG